MTNSRNRAMDHVRDEVDLLLLGHDWQLLSHNLHQEPEILQQHNRSQVVFLQTLHSESMLLTKQTPATTCQQLQSACAPGWIRRFMQQMIWVRTIWSEAWSTCLLLPSAASYLSGPFTKFFRWRWAWTFWWVNHIRTLRWEQKSISSSFF